ncbi:hypothetical protein MRB53_022026 [Persea americana]|uniref:Uncharacterized protein n=1 Tax=Persea americana TaxID=3435 RepID=A0ACC2L616_PERAE|nr:hypothetical protein MRB53_022026 [Persea americana]
MRCSAVWSSCAFCSGFQRSHGASACFGVVLVLREVMEHRPILECPTAVLGCSSNLLSFQSFALKFCIEEESLCCCPEENLVVVLGGVQHRVAGFCFLQCPHVD